MAAHHAISGTGVDSNGTLIKIATDRTSASQYTGSLTFLCADAARYLDELSPVDVIVCIGGEFIFGGYRQLLKHAKQRLAPQGRLLVGTIYWRQPPTAEYLALMDGDNPHFDLLTTVQIAQNDGYLPLGVFRSSDDEWDSFESHHAQQRYREAVQMRQPALSTRMWAWQQGYVRWGMETMGFCFLDLQRHDERAT